MEIPTSGVAARTLADLLPLAAQRFGDRIALVGEDHQATFSEVAAAAGSLRSLFADAGVATGHLVALAMHKTTDSFTIIHALLGAGAVVVPLDPLMPTGAMADLLASTEPRALVADEVTLGRLDPEAIGFPDIVFTTGEATSSAASLRAQIDKPTAGAPMPATVEPDDPAYVIFTSGSTGVPKGITHTHRSGLAYAELAVEVHGLEPADRLAGLPPLHFDMSTLELYAAPLAGASVVPIGTAELRFPASFTERAERAQTTVWYSVPFQLRQISERGGLEQRDWSALRHVIYAGEAFAPSALRALMHQLPGARFSNAYGPAETNVVTVHEVTGPPVGDVPIGRPWGDVEARVCALDAIVAEPADLVAVDTGEKGELWVNATSTMAGYLGRPDLDEGRLIGSGTDRWYRTGDLVIQDDTGTLRLAGRVDHQVKVRGTRLELESIERVLADNPQVAEAVVAPDLSGPSVEHLQAAVTLASGTPELDQRSLRRWCSARLASVAVPLDVEVWEEFPLTSSGKIDRKQVRASLNERTDFATHHNAAAGGSPIENGNPNG